MGTGSQDERNNIFHLDNRLYRSLCDVGAFEMMQVSAPFSVSGVQGFDGITESVHLFVIVKYDYSCSMIYTQTPLDHREM